MNQDAQLQSIIKKLEEDLSNSLDKFLFDHNTMSFPVRFENKYGKWEIHEDGRVLLQPHTPIEYIDVKITLNPNTAEFKNNL